MKAPGLVPSRARAKGQGHQPPSATEDSQQQLTKLPATLRSPFAVIFLPLLYEKNPTEWLQQPPSASLLGCALLWDGCGEGVEGPQGQAGQHRSQASQCRHDPRSRLELRLLLEKLVTSYLEKPLPSKGMGAMTDRASASKHVAGETAALLLAKVAQAAVETNMTF